LGKNGSIVIPRREDKYYWIGHDLFTKLIVLALSFMILHTSIIALLYGYRDLLSHLFFWKDSTCEVWDPLPWWWLYHVYWPMQFSGLDTTWYEAEPTQCEHDKDV
jgi:catechol O-methyltransferase